MEPKAFLESILAGLIEDKGALKIDQTQDQMGVLLTASVSRADMGRVIGRQGTTMKAIRHLLRVKGFIHAQSVSLKLLEPVVAPL